MSRPLSEEARDYITDLPFDRQDVAERWAGMPSDAFQARLGPMLDFMQASLTRPPWWRSAAADFGKVLGGIAAGFLAFWRIQGGN